MHIFSFISELRDLYHCSMVCRRWRDTVWSTREILDFTNYTKVNDDTIKFLAQECYMPRHLNLRYCRYVSDVGVRHISSLSSIQNLYLSGCDTITDEGLKVVATMTNLLQLYVSLCVLITDQGLDYICTLPKLKELFVSHSTTTDQLQLLLGQAIRLA